jgi:hypothetical protein
MLISTILTLVALGIAAGAIATKTTKPTESMTLDRLPILPRGVTVHEFSSRNKKGFNGDAEWHLYKDEKGDAVVFDATGPGCIRSFWETDIGPDQVWRFYFDGEKEPRYEIPVQDIFRGKHPLFSKELCTFDAVGTYAGDQIAGNCFVPIPFEKGLKIAIHGPFSFYHFIYERYPFGTPVKTFTGKEDREYLLKAFKEKGEELEPHADEEVLRTPSTVLEPNGRIDLMKVEKAGTICRVVVEGDGTDEFLNNVELEMQWDESPFRNVIAPVGMFFGSAIRAEEVRSLPTKIEKLPGGRVRMTNTFRMPFWRKGHVMLVNRQDKPSGPVTAEIHLSPQRYKEGETGYFNALYRDGRTDMGRDWLFCEGVGTGWFAGVVQTMFGSHYCEGDERFTSDGAGGPQVNGTGSEDYYLACYWPNKNFNYPFAGCVGDITQIPGPACYYRFHVEAPIPFYSSLDARIQHGGNSDIVSHYRSLGFYYIRKRPALTRTDSLDVGNEASEKAHGYHATRSKTTGNLDASYEGNAAWTTVRDSGRIHDEGEISFRVAVVANNDGVRLRRRLDQHTARQSAEVFVDGEPAGTWYHADGNPYLRWVDSDYDLPASLTKGKKSLEIKLVVRKEKGFGPFTDFSYEAFCFESR